MTYSLPKPHAWEVPDTKTCGVHSPFRLCVHDRNGRQGSRCNRRQPMALGWAPLSAAPTKECRLL
eukprot:CAMPEP_0174351624 /NCGR_PEP_ID=MMETSP0811_2-20130205/9045_1 /TAXON_ID=73025 ORGANISM="Eutreptiella gymnastica-like, Strain CCMP1594" /NCGR_SAMPLE_ID=MMETSP0811_2 /ASSEMBLY_ACC=CAM_ASM_000667 /LENGTH=64 /DNA_ID=CAMNT_0015481023 /DNA_START=1 /DNA_END=195 /DNA_ORIENTATION=+